MSLQTLEARAANVFSAIDVALHLLTSRQGIADIGDDGERLVWALSQARQMADRLHVDLIESDLGSCEL